MRVSAVIPARLQSTRLPRKVLLPIAGRPLLWWVYTRVKEARRVDEVVVVTDSEEVRDVVTQFGGRAVMTSPNCRSGSERIASALDSLSGDLILNVQGDEPLVSPELLDTMIDRCPSPAPFVITPVCRIKQQSELTDPNLVKVVRGGDGRALYFSRAAVPYCRDAPQDEWLRSAEYWSHVGIYGYSRDVLSRWSELPESALSEVEKLEQLRILEANIAIHTVETDHRAIGVDTEDDLRKVREILENSDNRRAA